MARRFPPMPRSLTLQGCFARVPSAKPNIQTTTKSAGLAFKGDTLASCPARGARACSGKTAASFNDDPKVALGGFGSSRCALGRLQLVHEGAVRSPLGALVLGVQSLDPWSAKNLKMKMEEKVNKKTEIGKVVEISVLGIATRLLRARREYLFPVQSPCGTECTQCAM